ncbi:hypothetical protein GIB67_011882 [Kingdonia uniflora]|uniref:Uncharacterized protein n=1 Tax=Kingdonia uniflora TaxID=39325 RepID=A0A7J7KVR2_9MAGN|nr:hypothetical protein GIB67_011882 [Kingdonia uniflora]
MAEDYRNSFPSFIDARIEDKLLRELNDLLGEHHKKIFDYGLPELNQNYNTKGMCTLFRDEKEIRTPGSWYHRNLPYKFMDKFSIEDFNIDAKLTAEDVFDSLAIPLMKLVGLKTEEMADEGRSSTILMDSTKHQMYRNCEFLPETSISFLDWNQRDEVLNLLVLVSALSLEYTRGWCRGPNAGTMIRLTSAVEKMERTVKSSRLELEEARKKVRVEEKRKSEALIKLKEVEEKGKAMRDFVGHLLEAKKKSKAPLVLHKVSFVDRASFFALLHVADILT